MHSPCNTLTTLVILQLLSVTSSLLRPPSETGNNLTSVMSSSILNCIKSIFLGLILCSHQSTAFLQIILASILWLCSKNCPGFSILQNKFPCQFFPLPHIKKPSKFLILPDRGIGNCITICNISFKVPFQGSLTLCGVTM